MIDVLNTNLGNGGIGYSKLPDGTMLQWGFYSGSLTTNGNSNSTKDISFPYTFSTNCHVCVNLTLETPAYQNGIMFDGLTFTKFRAILMGAPYANTPYDSPFRWLAIGRWK